MDLPDEPITADEVGRELLALVARAHRHGIDPDQAAARQPYAGSSPQVRRSKLLRRAILRRAKVCSCRSPRCHPDRGSSRYPYGPGPYPPQPQYPNQPPPQFRQPPPPQYRQPQPSPETRRDVEAAWAARLELGMDFEEHIAAGLAERVEELAAYRAGELRYQAEAAQRLQRSEQSGRGKQFALGIVSLVAGRADHRDHRDRDGAGNLIGDGHRLGRHRRGQRRARTEQPQAPVLTRRSGLPGLSSGVPGRRPPAAPIG